MSTKILVKALTANVNRVTQLPMTTKLWCLELDCGHDRWVISKSKPKRKIAKCGVCKMGVPTKCLSEVGREREACATMVENITMGEMLLAGGEMTAGERRTCKAMLKWVAHKIRTR